MEKDTKQIVREKYAEIVTQKSGCCGPSCCGPTEEIATVFAEGYESLPGYVPEADLGLGCGLPTESARIQPGQAVLDLGSGAGNDVFIARQLTGAAGRVTGIDFTREMVDRANVNKARLGYENVEFVHGDIEEIPLPDAQFDVVISNCVLNLVPGKEKAYREIFRVLRPGGHFAISDVVVTGELPAGLQEAAEMYAGCVAGAMEREAYLEVIRSAGFTNLRIEKDKVIHLPDELLRRYVSEEELQAFRRGDHQIRSLTIYAERP